MMSSRKRARLRAASSGIVASQAQCRLAIPDSRALRRTGFRDDRLSRLIVCAFAMLSATTVIAAELPIDGIYGDEMGCQRLVPSNAIDEPGGINVFADRIEGYEWGCSWAEVWEYPHSDGRGFGVQGLCGGEGIPFLEQYIIEFGFDDPTQMTVFAANGDPRWELNLCEATPRQGGKG
jgi:hypothetical protein